eukprot:TRINITY_DN12991_c0_g1_i3.p3 TRINITY_DN12991_c0_g1~~TRINITY_DN12991_c0_g1_i3.p3  ORF type:complete len:495 (+),score=147.97 TRINITY_DN12991_c0_g1_i3:66-1487(+)
MPRYGCDLPPHSVVTLSGQALPPQKAPPGPLPRALQGRPVEARRLGGQQRGGIFAAEDIPAGTVVLRERPFLTATLDEYADPSALLRRLQRGAPKDVWDGLRRLEACGEDVATPEGLRTALACNVFALAGEVLAFDAACHFNHSCTPNVHAYCGGSPPEAVLHTVADVPRGAELTLSYWRSEHGWGAAARRAALLQQKRFLCRCTACQGPDPGRPAPCPTPRCGGLALPRPARCAAGQGGVGWGCPRCGAEFPDGAARPEALREFTRAETALAAALEELAPDSAELPAGLRLCCALLGPLHWLSCRAAGALLAQSCGPATDGRTPPQLRAGGRAALLRGYAAWHRRWCAATGAAVAPQWAVGQLLSAGLLLAAHAPPEPGDRPAAAAALHAVLPWHCAIYGAAHRDSRRAADCLSALGGAPADSCGDCGGSCGRPECGDRAALAGWADACAPAPAAEAAFRRRVAVPLPVSVP